jgi:dihydroxyacetone kinase
LAHFINDRASLVTDAIDGLVAGSGGALARLDGYPEIRVVLRAEPEPEKVAVVSGGGSGTSRPMPASSGRGCSRRRCVATCSPRPPSMPCSPASWR